MFVLIVLIMSSLHVESRVHLESYHDCKKACRAVLLLYSNLDRSTTMRHHNPALLCGCISTKLLLVLYRSFLAWNNTNLRGHTCRRGGTRDRMGLIGGLRLHLP